MDFYGPIDVNFFELRPLISKNLQKSCSHAVQKGQGPPGSYYIPYATYTHMHTFQETGCRSKEPPAVAVSSLDRRMIYTIQPSAIITCIIHMHSFFFDSGLPSRSCFFCCSMVPILNSVRGVCHGWNPHIKYAEFFAF
jgi:hypothetical protein